MPLYVDNDQMLMENVCMTEEKIMTEFFTTGDISKDARVSPQAISQAMRRGELKAAAKTRGGISLFDPETVDKFLADRKSKNGK
jgi:hypothetical protein